MSYEIIRSINEKEHKITYATNNIRPLMFSTWTMKFKDGSPVSDRDFQVYMMRQLLEGNFHASFSHKYSIIANAIRNTRKYRELDEKLWNWNDTYTDEYMKANWETNSKELDKYIRLIYPICDKYISMCRKQMKILPVGTKLNLEYIREQKKDANSKLVDDVRPSTVEKHQDMNNTFFRNHWYNNSEHDSIRDEVVLSRYVSLCATKEYNMLYEKHKIKKDVEKELER